MADSPLPLDSSTPIVDPSSRMQQLQQMLNDVQQANIDLQQRLEFSKQVTLELSKEIIQIQSSLQVYQFNQNQLQLGILVSGQNDMPQWIGGIDVIQIQQQLTDTVSKIRQLPKGDSTSSLQTALKRCLKSGIQRRKLNSMAHDQ
jgi:hypothetical protein